MALCSKERSSKRSESFGVVLNVNEIDAIDGRKDVSKYLEKASLSNCCGNFNHASRRLSDALVRTAAGCVITSSN